MLRTGFKTYKEQVVEFDAHTSAICTFNEHGKGMMTWTPWQRIASHRIICYMDVEVCVMSCHVVLSCHVMSSSCDGVQWGRMGPVNPTSTMVTHTQRSHAISNMCSMHTRCNATTHDARVPCCTLQCHAMRCDVMCDMMM